MTVLLPSSIRNARKKVRPLAPVRPARADALNYYDQVKGLNKELIHTGDTVARLVDSGSEASHIADVLQAEFNKQQKQYSALSTLIATGIAQGLSDSNKRKVENTVAASLGISTQTSTVVKTANATSPFNPFDTVDATIDTSSAAFSLNSVNILDDPIIANIVQASVLENSQLIRSIVPQYFSQVAQAVSANFRGEQQVGGVSLVERLQEIGGITENRARFIARDQTAKLTSSLTRARHEAVGISSYRWKNSNDERVVGNPAGLYPKGNKGHGNHWVRENKLFSYDKPPSDGNPGQPFNCRCTAEAVLNLDDLEAVYG